MIGFHIDMNIAQFRRDYLEKWLYEFSSAGYEVILWEVENNVRWETCPECNSPDAFSKNEFREILELGRSLGLEPIPLFQTLAHCEYVLKHENYIHLAEIEGETDQYCPCNDDLMPFLHQWIEEYLELFGEVDYFHVGADEAGSLGKCDRCSAFVAKHSLSELYIQHVRAVCEPLLSRKIKPIVWADMVLTRRESIEKLPPDTMLFDWMYDIYRGNGKVWVWEEGQKGLFGTDDLNPEYLQTFEDYLFPSGKASEGEPETFYTADYLADRGFQVLTCPSSSSYGDNVFSPRNRLHLANTFDSFQKGMSPNLRGSVLTSWTVHLFPWELQRACIYIPLFIRQYPEKKIEEFPEFFTEMQFGLSDPAFFEACDLLSGKCLFTHTRSLGFDKRALPVSLDHSIRTIEEIKWAGALEMERSLCERRIGEYHQALTLFTDFYRKATVGRELLDCWLLAARNLLNRAEVSRFLLEYSRNPGHNIGEGIALLETMRSLRDETDSFYSSMVKPTRKKEILSWMFDSVEHALARATA